MSEIYYWHVLPSPNKNGKEEFRSDFALPYGHGGSETFMDCIYHSRNAYARFYIVVCGYEKGWANRVFTAKKNSYILHFFFDGEGLFNNEPIRKGDIRIALPNETYTIHHSEKKPLTFGWISLEGKELELMMEILHLPSKHPLPMDNEQQEIIQSIILDTVYQPHPKKDIPYFLFGQFFRLLANAGIPYSYSENTDNFYVNKAINYINIHYAENISVVDIAKEIRLSVSHLRNLFASELGYSPQQALISKRISVACALMQSHSNLSIQEIANACGYEDQGAFSRRFKSQMGMSPSTYQSMLRRP